MPRFSKNHVPTYRLHKRSGNAVVTIGGKDHYLGQFDTPKSRERYNQLIADWFKAGRQVERFAIQRAVPSPAGPTVNDIILRFVMHARDYYRDRDGEASGEFNNFKGPIKTLRRLYGSLNAADFRPNHLRSCQQDMIAAGISRKSINRRIGRIRQIFKWAVGGGEELIPAAVLEGLRAVDPLKMWRTEARETEPVKPAQESIVMAAIASADRFLAAMIELQWITGMRPGELVIMRTADIDRSEAEWVYTPRKHKTQHHGHGRAIYLGERAKSILQPFLKLDGEAFIFDPRRADDERREARRANRKTPLSCGNRQGTNVAASPKKSIGERFTVKSYARAVYGACAKGFVPPFPLGPDEKESERAWKRRLTAEQRKELLAWQRANRFHPHQLRHAAGTRFRREFGPDAARALLGQKTLKATEVYAELDMNKAREAMRKIG